MGQYLLGPSSTKSARKADRAPRCEYSTVELKAARRPSFGAVLARRVDGAREARQDRLNGHLHPYRPRAVGADLCDGAGYLVAKKKRWRGERHEYRVPVRIGNEQMKVAPTDTADGDRDSCPFAGRQLGLGDLNKGSRKLRICVVKAYGLHRGIIPSFSTTTLINEESERSTLVRLVGVRPIYSRARTWIGAIGFVRSHNIRATFHRARQGDRLA